MSAVQSFHIKDEHIRLGQALKAAGLAESGVDAKYAVLDGLVKGERKCGASEREEALSGRYGGISGRSF